MSTGLAVLGTLAGQGLETGLNLWNRKHMEEREDTAMQRRVADLKAAGINPMLAAGQPASSQQGHQQSIDTNMAQDLMVTKELQKLSEENKNLIATRNYTQQQYDNLVQEYEERGRNIRFYKDLDLPSDRPDSWITQLAQIVHMLKNPNIASDLGAGIDYMKGFFQNKIPMLNDIPQAAKDAVEKTKEVATKAVDSYTWFLQHTPLGLAVKGTQKAWEAFQNWRKETFKK